MYGYTAAAAVCDEIMDADIVCYVIMETDTICYVVIGAVLEGDNVCLSCLFICVLCVCLMQCEIWYKCVFVHVLRRIFLFSDVKVLDFFVVSTVL